MRNIAKFIFIHFKFPYSQAQQNRGPAKYSGREFAANHLQPNDGLSQQAIADRLSRSASIGEQQQHQRPAINAEFDRRARVKARPFERNATLSAANIGAKVPVPMMSLAASRSRGRTHSMVSRSTTTTTLASLEPLTRSRKARVFQDRRSSGSESTTDNAASATSTSTIRSRLATRQQNSEFSGSLDDTFSRPDGFARGRSRQRSTTVTNNGINSNAATQQSPISEQRKLSGASRNARRFNYNTANGLQMEATTSEIPRNQPHRPARPSKFSRAPVKQAPLPAYVNAAFYDENYPDRYKFDGLAASRRIDINPDSLEQISEARSAFRLDTQPKIDIKLEPTTQRNRYTTRQNYKFSLPAYKRPSSITTPRSREISRFRGVGYGSQAARSSPSKFSTKFTTSQPPKRSYTIYSPRPPIMAAYSKKFVSGRVSSETSSSDETDKDFV